MSSNNIRNSTSPSPVDSDPGSASSYFGVDLSFITEPATIVANNTNSYSAPSGTATVTYGSGGSGGGGTSGNGNTLLGSGIAGIAGGGGAFVYPSPIPPFVPFYETNYTNSTDANTAPYYAPSGDIFDVVITNVETGQAGLTYTLQDDNHDDYFTFSIPYPWSPRGTYNSTATISLRELRRTWKVLDTTGSYIVSVRSCMSPTGRMRSPPPSAQSNHQTQAAQAAQTQYSSSPSTGVTDTQLKALSDLLEANIRNSLFSEFKREAMKEIVENIRYDIITSLVGDQLEVAFRVVLTEKTKHVGQEDSVRDVKLLGESIDFVDLSELKEYA
jgi:hypothetical protein